MAIGQSLKYYRTREKLTQEGLAKILNVSRQTISKWENDRSFPDIETLIWLCDIYHVSLDNLVGRETVSYDPKILRKKNKRKDLISMFPKYTNIVLSGILLLLIIFAGVGQYRNDKTEEYYRKSGNLLTVYDVQDALLGEDGMYESLVLSNGESIPATRQTIEDYELESKENKVVDSIPLVLEKGKTTEKKTYIHDSSPVFYVLETKYLKE